MLATSELVAMGSGAPGNHPDHALIAGLTHFDCSALHVGHASMRFS